LIWTTPHVPHVNCSTAPTSCVASYPTKRSAVCPLGVHIFALGVVVCVAHGGDALIWVAKSGSRPAARVELFNFASYHALKNSERERENSNEINYFLHILKPFSNWDTSCLCIIQCMPIQYCRRCFSTRNHTSTEASSHINNFYVCNRRSLSEFMGGNKV
jgi:hypothetical protein